MKDKTERETEVAEVPRILKGLDMEHHVINGANVYLRAPVTPEVIAMCELMFSNPDKKFGN